MLEVDEADDVLDVPEPDVPEPDVPEPGDEDVDDASDFLAEPSLDPLAEALEPDERESLR